MRRPCAVFLIILFLFSTANVQAQPQENPGQTATREFIASCTYGVLAGTLVGAASLAFTDRPGDKLNRVARGASLGLYTGILLGLYVVYIVPSLGNESDEDPMARLDRMPVSLTPTFGTQDGPDGASLAWIYRF